MLAIQLPMIYLLQLPSPLSIAVFSGRGFGNQNQTWIPPAPSISYAILAKIGGLPAVSRKGISLVFSVASVRARPSVGIDF